MVHRATLLTRGFSEHEANPGHYRHRSRSAYPLMLLAAVVEVGGEGGDGFGAWFGVAAEGAEVTVAAFGVPPMCWTLGLCGCVMVVVVLPFVWWLVPDGGVEPAGVVPGLDPPSD